jgi:hypothetical protein
VYRIQFPSTQATALPGSFGQPHGIALNGGGTTLYVADHGLPPQTDGRILAVAVP